MELLPSSSEDWSQLGLIQGQLGKYAEAAEAFEAAFRLDPEDVWSLYNLGHAYEGLHRAADAEKQYRRAADIKPRFGPAWLALGKLVEARGAKAEAESDYRLAITNRVHHTPELLTLARFCRDRGWGDDAVNIFDEAGRLSPGDKLIPYEAGLLEVQAAQAAIKNGNAQAESAYRASAANHFRQVIQLDPNYMPAHFECGMMTTDPGESVREFAAALKLDPTQIATRMNLAMALERAGRPNDALGEYQAILQADPATTPAQYKTTAQQHIEKLQGASSAPNQ